MGDNCSGTGDADGEASLPHNEALSKRPPTPAPPSQRKAEETSEGQGVGALLRELQEDSPRMAIDCLLYTSDAADDT
eukprot:6392655-Pyramimonas_sp.AAC.1